MKAAPSFTLRNLLKKLGTTDLPDMHSQKISYPRTKSILASSEACHCASVGRNLRPGDVENAAVVPGEKRKSHRSIWNVSGTLNREKWLSPSCQRPGKLRCVQGAQGAPCGTSHTAAQTMPTESRSDCMSMEAVSFHLQMVSYSLESTHLSQC